MAWSGAVAASLAVGLGLVVARAERERRAARAAARSQRQARRFGLLSDETPAYGFRRVALAQLDLAIELLGGALSSSASSSSVPPEEAVHETRKALKRVRALMRLLEGELGVKRARRERAVLRDAAARLAGARDAEVMVSTLDALVERHPRKLGGRRGVVELREELERERMRASARTPGDALTRARVAEELSEVREELSEVREELSEVREELSEVRARVARWKLPVDRSAAGLTGAGLEHIYRAGRAGRRRSSRGRAGPRALHKWRKHVKDLRYGAEVLEVREPAGAGTGSKRSRKRRPEQIRRAAKQSKRIAKVARRADRLGEVLGEEHDLMLLGERVRAHKPLKRRRKRTRKRLLRAISRRRKQLRKRALRDGKRLYALGPRRFVRKMRA